jgi:pimeloyl-ACP methyl ester carboxylesterase
VREQCLRFGDGLRLFGITSEPKDGSPRPDRPAVLFLNVGANHHVGPNRMYVVLARELAARGYLGFRFDVSGFGDSQIAPGGSENRLYSKDSLGDVKTAMTFLTDRFGVRRFVVIGLCSGAYMAFHSCVEDPRVAGQILLNPQKLDWREGDSLELSMRKSFGSNRFYARALLDRTVWRRALRGEVNVRAVMGIVHERLLAHAKSDLRSLSARLRGRAEPQTEIERAFHAVTRRGVDTLFVFSWSDGGIDHMERHLGRGARKMREYKNFRLQIVDGADHTFTQVSAQGVLYDLVVDHVTSRFP